MDQAQKKYDVSLGKNIIIREEYFIKTKGVISFNHYASDFEKNDIHSHEICELLIVISGDMNIFVENQIYIPHSGAIFTFRPGELHHGISLSKKLHERYGIHFASDVFNFVDNGDKILRCFFERENGKNNMALLPPEQTSVMLESVGEMYRILRNQHSGYQIFALSYLIRLLEYANQYYLKSDNIKFNYNIPRLLSDIIQYINESYITISHISDLTKKFYVSESYISRLFKQHLDLSPYHYVLSKKINYSKGLLQNGCSVKEACIASGFNDYSHYISMFKRFTNMTPTQYCQLYL